MPANQICPKCGVTLPGHALEGLCPGCALEGALLRGHGPESPDSARKNERFGDYELVEEIARGGMGVVFRARQTSLDRIVAVKLILFNYFADDAAVKRFRAEAAAAARLQHPNIVAIHDIAEQDGQPFFSMDYVEGRNLAEFARQHPLTAHEAARMLQTIAEAIHYAHQQGIIHRDIKPSNILIDAHGQPRVTDFGLAKQMGSDSSFPALPSSLTLSGQLLGSPNFMPPEQVSARRSEIGPASDIYSLGAVLYHLLTGRPPFAADSLTDTLQQVVHTDPISPRALNPGVPRDLETICLKCLEKEPAGRYSTAAALAEDLGRFLRDETIAARPVSRPERFFRWCRRKPMIASLSAMVLLLLILGFWGVLWQLHRARQRSAEDRERLVRLNVNAGIQLIDQGDLINALPWLAGALRLDSGHPESEAIHRLRIASVLDSCPRVQMVVSHDAQITCAEFSPDGSRIVTASRDRTARVWDAATGQAVTPPLRHTGVVRWATFSPDGRFVGTASADKTAVIWDVATGQPSGPPLGHSKDVRLALFHPDGRRLLTVSTDGRQASEVRMWDVATGRLLTAPMSPPLEVQQAVFSPDGRHIAMACGYTDSRRGEVWVWDAESGKPLAGPARHSSGVYRVAFSPDGASIVAAGGNVSVFGEVRIWDRALREGREVKFSPKGRASCAAFSPDGLRVLTGGYDRQVQVWDPDTGESLTPPLKHAGLVTDAAFSPDGRWIVTAGADLTARLWDARTGEAVGPPLPHLSGLDSARFSPDGRRVLTAGLEPVVRVWALPARTQTSTILRHDSNLRHASFSPNSAQVATATGLGQCRIWETATGRVLTELRHHTGLVWRAAFSPDGSRVITASREQSAVMWEAATGRLITRLGESNAIPDVAFSPDGKYAATGDSDGKARVWDAATGRAITPPLEHGNGVDFVEFSSDGRWLLTTAQGAPATAQQVGLWELPAGTRIPHSLKHRDRVMFASLSPDGRRLVTASRDQTARVWEFGSWRPLTPPLRHNGPVSRAFFSPDGRRVITASMDATARVWDAATGDPVTPPLKHKMDLFHVAFSPDGRLVATASWDGTARAWETATGDAVTPFLRHDDVSRNPVEHVAFSPDGHWVVTASWDNTARLWPLQATDRAADELLRLAEVQSGQRISTAHSTAGELSPLHPKELLAAWHDLNSRNAPHAEAEAIGEGERAWHRQQADEAERVREWFAAQWHLEKLIAELPEDADLRRRRDAAIALAAQARHPLRRASNLDDRLPPRTANTPPESVDLTAYYNATLTESWHSLLPDENNLANLPPGTHNFGGVLFDVRGLIQLAGTGDSSSPLSQRFPKQVNGIRVGRTCRSLHFLHATIWSTSIPDGVPVGRYVVHFADGVIWQIPILYGRDLRDWWTLPGEATTTSGAAVVWTGVNPSADKRGSTLRLFKRTWELPLTSSRVENIDFVSSLSASAPFLIAITVE